MIFTGMSGALEGTGFRLSSSQEHFARRIATGRQELAVPLWDHQPVFRFSLVAGVRLDAVEAVFNEFSGATGKNAALTLTTMTPLPFFGEYVDVHSVNDALHTQPREGFDTTEPLSHAMHALIVARLADDPGLSRHISRYEAELSGLHPQLRVRFDGLLQRRATLTSS
ncbi:hypothetical protein [Kineococcus arenarius]|uniref:hypothetical protein n=1 Tax=unclassified Kineococcus TaxID=2621656 RepID=UPI003D7F1517